MSQIAQIILRKTEWKNKALWLQTILYAYSYQNSMFQSQNRNTHQWNWLESPGNKPTHLCSINLSDRGGRTIQWKKDGVSDKWYQENWKTTCKKMTLEYSQTFHTKTNSKCIKDLNIRMDTIKLANIGRPLFNIHCNSIFLNLSSEIGEIKTKIKQMRPN